MVFQERTIDELMNLFQKIDESYERWTEEMESGEIQPLDEFYRERGFRDAGDFFVTFLMYKCINDMNMDLTVEINKIYKESNLSPAEIRGIRKQRLSEQSEDYYAYAFIRAFLQE